MAIQSTLVTASSASAVRKYELTVNSKINSSSFALNDQANDYYSAICKNYDNLKTSFTKVADLYSTCATKAIAGQDLKKALNKISTNCKNQGTYCGDRKNDLKDGYKFSKLEAKYYKILEELSKYKSSTK